MSYNNNDDFNQSRTTGEGFNDARGGVETYGQDQGSGAYDPSQQRASDDQTFRAPENFDNSPGSGFGQSQSQSQQQGSQRAFGGDRSTEKPGFSGSDQAYDTTATGGAFAQRSSSGVGQSGGFGDDNTSNIPGSRSRGAASGGRYDNTGDDVRDRDQWDSSRSEQFGGESQGERQSGKPTFGDKMRGNVEKLAGKVAGKQDLQERGQERKTGDF